MQELRKLWPLFMPETPEPWRPLADVYRTREGWLVKFDLAGVPLEDVSVGVRGRRVSISGFRKDTVVEEGFSHYSLEISYSRFERTVEIPCSLDHAQVTVQARDGIVMVHMSMEGNENVR